MNELTNTFENTRVYLIGASGHASVIAEIIETTGYSVAGVFDRNPQIKKLLHREVALQKEDLPQDGNYLICTGNNRIRKQIAERYHEHLSFGKAIHSSAVISTYATLQEGTVIMAGVAVNANSKIGKHVILNTNCSLDHDCQLEDYVHISPNAALAGNVTVGEGSHIGIGACIIQGITIGKWCTIGAGAVVIRDVPDGATVVGNPGRIIKQTNT